MKKTMLTCDTLDIIDTERHPNIRKAIADHEAETLNKFNQEIETKTAADILASWYLKQYTTPKTLEAIKNTAPEEKPAADILAKMKTKKAREEAKNTTQRLEALALAESCKLPESVNISVEFTRSRTWGSIPHATITAEQRRTFGTASGCGYDKESAARVSRIPSILSSGCRPLMVVAGSPASALCSRLAAMSGGRSATIRPSTPTQSPANDNERHRAGAVRPGSFRRR